MRRFSSLIFFLIIFKAIRNTEDLKTIAIPKKYLKHFGDFWEYYSGEKKAEILTLVIGGNHEASHYMRELYYGGWLAPNIFYFGAAGVVNLNFLNKGKISKKIFQRKF